MTRHRYGVFRSAAFPIAGCVAGVALLVAGCTSGSADGTTGSSTSASSAAPTPSVAELSPSASSAAITSADPASTNPSSALTQTSESLDPAAQEAADRAAIEAQWNRFWGVYENIIRTPAATRDAALDTVSVDPIKSRILDAANKSAAQGIDYYGSVVEHPYWIQSVSGKDFAVMRDCQDQSQYGSIEVASGNKRTVGVAKDSLQVGFVRDAEGVWRVQNIQFLEDVPC